MPSFLWKYEPRVTSKRDICVSFRETIQRNTTHIVVPYYRKLTLHEIKVLENNAT